MYKVIILPQALEDLAKLDNQIAQRIIDKLTWLSENMETISPLSLKGKLSGFFKLRIGDWRVIYNIERNNKIITVHKVGP